MNEINLSAVDMNLLVTLEVLLRHESVTEAAQELGLSQSAVSHALERLRELLGDELLVRSGRKMVPTARAKALEEPLRRSLGELARVITPEPPFDPATDRGRLTLAASDFAQFVLLPLLIPHLQERAPGIDLRVRELGGSSPVQRLAEGELDMALTLGLPDQVSPSLYRADLFEIELVSVVRKDHPRVGERLDLELFCELAHVLVSPRGHDQGVVDLTLRQRGLSRRVAVVVPNFLVAPYVVAGTDMVLTTSRRVVESLGEALPLKIVEPPLELMRGTVSLVWHPRSHKEARHRWMRDQIRDLVEAYGL